MDEQRASPIHMHKQEQVQTPFFAFSLHVLEQKKTNCWYSLWAHLKISLYFNKKRIIFC